MDWSEDQWRQYFDDIGAAGYGWISRTEFEAAINADYPDTPQEELDAAWTMADVNEDGQMNWDEFWALVQMKMGD